MISNRFNRKKAALGELLQASRQAFALAEPFTRTRLIAKDKLLGELTDHLNPLYRRYVEQLALELGAERGALVIDVSVFFEPEAFELATSLSASPYWFWRIVAATAERSQELPFRVDDINEGVAEIRRGIAAHYGKQDLSVRAWQLSVSASADRLKQSGLIYHVEGAWKKNPLIA